MSKQEQWKGGEGKEQGTKNRDQVYMQRARAERAFNSFLDK
jgi:hypothetical protein